MHHIIGDQWSFGVIGSEFAFFYNAFCRGEVPPTKPIPLQYADYAVWQRRCLTDEWLSIQSDYWQKKLAGLSKLSLPTDYPRPMVQTFNGAHCLSESPASLIERLKQFSAEQNTTVFMTLLACFQILLSRYSGQSDIAVGSPIANRTQSAVESIIGSLFVNTLVLRTDLSGNPTFLEILARVRDTALGAYANQDFPFDKLVETMHSTRDHSSAPLVQVLFNLPNAPIGEINVHGLSWVPFEVDSRSAQFDLSLTIETEVARKAYLTFNTDLFDRQTAERMLGQIKVLLQSALAHPSTKLSDLPILSVARAYPGITGLESNAHPPILSPNVFLRCLRHKSKRRLRPSRCRWGRRPYDMASSMPRRTGWHAISDHWTSDLAWWWAFASNGH